MQSPDGKQLWCPGPSLWNLISEHAHAPELPKIRSALGHSLVDMYTDLHTEAEMWYKMWQESQRGCQQGSPLPDPPAVKELVRAEVKMLLQTLREKASNEGRDGEELLFRYNPEIVKYALGHCTNAGDTDNESRPSSHCSVQSNAEDEIEAVRDKLNVTDIDQVVDHLKSAVMEECEVLKRLVQHLRENLKQNYRCKSVFDKSEPSLAELRELRGAVQMDLELYPSSFAASPTAPLPLPVKEVRNRFRPSAGLRASDETLRALTAASALRPHPPLRHTNRRPPAGPPHTKTSSSVKPINAASPSMTQHRSTSGITNSSNKITSSEHMNSHFTTDHPDQCSAGLHHRNTTPGPTFQISTQRKSCVHEVHLSSHRSPQNRRKFDLSPQRERKGSVWRSRNINITPPHVPTLSSLCDAGSCSSNSSDHSVSATEKTQNGQQKSTCKSSSMSTAVQIDNDRLKNNSENLYLSALSETGSPPSQNSSRKSSSGIGGDKNGRLRKDVNQQPSLRSHCLTHHSSHQSDNGGEQRKNKSGQPESIQINRQLFTSPKRPLRGTTSQQKKTQEAQVQLETVKFYQPVPPARVST